MIYWLTFGSSLLLCWLSLPLIRKYSFKAGWVSLPRTDRWHRTPTPTMGGIAIFLAVFSGVFLALIFLVFLTPASSAKELPAPGVLFKAWGFLIGSIFIFFLGWYDDVKHISPPAKLIGQIIAAAIVISLGYTTHFFTPKISNNLVAQLPNTVLTFIWLVGITNAINLLDNMDGLAGGISFITTLLLGYLFWRAGNYSLVLVCAAISGSLIGFLIFNYPPASIFMGDSGSMFLGFTLACLAIVRQPQASNVFGVLGVPTLLFLLPILDTILVALTRLLRGESPLQGGRDHTSHRLIAFGLTEHQTLWFLYATAIFSGVVAIAIEAIGYWLSLVLVPVVVVGLALTAAYLGGMKLSEPGLSPKSDQGQPVLALNPAARRRNPLMRVIVNLTYKRRILEVILDFVIIVLAFYMAFLTRYSLQLSNIRLVLFSQALPVVLVVTYLVLFLNSIYKGVWRYISTDDFLQYLKAAIIAAMFSAVCVYLLYYLNTEVQKTSPWTAYSPTLFLLYAIFLFLGLSATRSSFKVLDRFAVMRNRKTGERVVILGTGSTGEMALRWILMNPEMNYHPIGFIEEDPLLAGRTIHGVAILGDMQLLSSLLAEQQVDGVILVQGSTMQASCADAVKLAQEKGCWVRRFSLEFELME